MSVITVMFILITSKMGTHQQLLSVTAYTELATVEMKFSRVSIKEGMMSCTC